MDRQSEGPHQGQPVRRAGSALADARGAAILIHGRGATADGILSLADVMARPDFSYLAPQAAGNAWYPHRFMAPVEANQPHLDSALAVISGLLDHLAAAGFPAERVALIGFSQGACLALEYAARMPRRYGAVIGFAGGLIGETVDGSRYQGSLTGTPTFLGCGDDDAHIPIERVLQSAEVLRGLGAEVTQRTYPGLPHTVNDDEIAFARRLLARIAADAPSRG
jgi:predicted esterase